MPHGLRPNTYNSCFEVNLTKVGFGDGGHCLQQVPTYPICLKF
jgi:hypothetical protein